MRRIFGGFLVACAITIAASEAALAQAVREVISPVVLAVFNQCNGQTILVDGKLTTLVRSDGDGSGGSHLLIHIVSKGTAVDEMSAVDYVYSEEFLQEIQTSGTTQQVALTQVLNHVLTSQGQSGNAFLKITAHVTVNANGVVTATVSNVDTGCRG